MFEILCGREFLAEFVGLLLASLVFGYFGNSSKYTARISPQGWIGPLLVAAGIAVIVQTVRIWAEFGWGMGLFSAFLAAVAWQIAGYGAEKFSR